MGNLDGDTKEYDRQVRAGAKQYDEELYDPKWEGWDYDDEEDEEDEEDWALVPNMLATTGIFLVSGFVWFMFLGWVFLLGFQSNYISGPIFVILSCLTYLFVLISIIAILNKEG